VISIIIPAHNEEKVIAETLKELIRGVYSGELEVIVVCNGCTDNTSGVVASFGKSIKCIETPVPSKSNALNLGDAAASGFPRIYQDADVVLSLNGVRRIIEALQAGRFLAAAPKMRMDLMQASFGVRSYYAVWQELSYVQEGMIGTGVFALSKEGRKRFEKFPPIIADDGFVRSLFQPHERTSVDSCYSLVRAPQDLKGLLKIKTRSRLGGYELKKQFPALAVNKDKMYGKAFLGVLAQPKLWPKITVYLYINLAARFRAAKHARTVGYAGWERDDTSREMIKPR
jgi:hypothetical protein